MLPNLDKDESSINRSMYPAGSNVCLGQQGAGRLSVRDVLQAENRASCIKYSNGIFNGARAFPCSYATPSYAAAAPDILSGEETSHIAADPRDNILLNPALGFTTLTFDVRRFSVFNGTPFTCQRFRDRYMIRSDLVLNSDLPLRP
jgi:hypothetical protein